MESIRGSIRSRTIRPRTLGRPNDDGDLLARCEEDQDANPEHQIALKDRGLLALACKLEHG